MRPAPSVQPDGFVHWNDKVAAKWGQRQIQFAACRRRIAPADASLRICSTQQAEADMASLVRSGAGPGFKERVKRYLDPS